MEQLTVIHYETLPEAADDNRRYVEKVMEQLAERQTPGVRYAAFLLDDGVTFVHLAMSGEGANPLLELPAFQEFQEAHAERRATDLARHSATVVGDYRLLQG